MIEIRVAAGCWFVFRRIIVGRTISFELVEVIALPMIA